MSTSTVLPSSLAPTLVAMAGEAVRLQARLDLDWLADCAHAAAHPPPDHPLAAALHRAIAPTRQNLARFEFTVNGELALTHRREGSILFRPLSLGYLATTSATAATDCRLSLVVTQTPPTPLSS